MYQRAPTRVIGRRLEAQILGCLDGGIELAARVVEGAQPHSVFARGFTALHCLQPITCRPRVVGQRLRVFRRIESCRRSTFEHLQALAVKSGPALQGDQIVEGVTRQAMTKTQRVSVIGVQQVGARKFFEDLFIQSTRH